MANMSMKAIINGDAPPSMAILALGMLGTLSFFIIV